MSSFLEGMSAFISSPSAVLVAIIGSVAGILVGAVPGLSGTTAVALLLPFSFYLDPLIALILMYTISKSSDFGGSIPGILFNTPGTPSAAATMIEGHPLARKGYPVKALRAATAASATGDFFSECLLIFGAAYLAVYAVKIGPPELVTIYIMAFVVISSIIGESMIKGIISTLFGITLALVGFDPISGNLRMTFDQLPLMDGLPLVPALIGIFVVGEVFHRFDVKDFGASTQKDSSGAGSAAPDVSRPDDTFGLRDYLRVLPTIVRSMFIGASVGMFPGIGASVASFLSFGEARRQAKPDDDWGHGEVKGVAASEAANNATSGANLIPLLTLGIPGSTQAALLAGAMLIHGITVGPQVFTEDGVLIYSLFSAGLFCILAYFVVGFWFSPMIGRIILAVPARITYSLILMISVSSAYVLHSSLFDVWIMVLFGVLGYLFRRYNYNIPAFMIALLLGGGMERAARQTMLLDNDGLWIIFQRPISLTILILTVIMVIMRIRKARINKALAALQDD
ncbi:tripartite tricarboxylate transporter permease [Shimia sp. R11_0]|uniref:tripartite tricarboxylate transporter permease n=1 Tax=Shimia sp. R11_0 TaxID=2821096 RepID=UPI001ADB16C5|nr:tripartite tricarboxylate transporter permease [Shimia sp. R11_0]MBO9477853.1 tripartite tricarboxylate transporter permease [Shimia sp. R11_0]